MSPAKAVALALVLACLALFALLRGCASVSEEVQRNDIEKARQNISTFVGAEVTFEKAVWWYPWVCGTYVSPGSKPKQFSYMLHDRRIGLEDVGDVPMSAVSSCAKSKSNAKCR